MENDTQWAFRIVVDTTSFLRCVPAGAEFLPLRISLYFESLVHESELTCVYLVFY